MARYPATLPFHVYTPADLQTGLSGTIFCVIAERELVPRHGHQLLKSRCPVILQLRLFALYRLNRKVLVTMVVSFIVTVTSSGTLMGVALRDLSGEECLKLPFPPTPSQRPVF